MNQSPENSLPARLLSVNDVARFLGVHPSTVRRWEKQGLLRSYAIGIRRNLRFKQEDVLDFLSNSNRDEVGQGAESNKVAKRKQVNGKAGDYDARG